MSGINKTAALLLSSIVFTATVLSCFSIAAANPELNSIYDGPATGDDVIASLDIKFSVKNGSVLSGEDLALDFSAYQGFSDNMQTLMAALYSVSYEASWQDQPVVVYQWSIHNPASQSDDDSNPQQFFSYTVNLTGVPDGPQHIEVTAVGGGYIWGTEGSKAYYQTFSKTSVSSLNFNISHSPLGTPDSTFSPDSGILWKTNVLWNLTSHSLSEAEIRGEERTWMDPLVDGNIIYCGAQSMLTINSWHMLLWSDVYAFNATNGAKIWEYSGNLSDRLTNLAVANGMVYFGAGVRTVDALGHFVSGDYVTALNASNGKLLWQTVCSGRVSSVAVANGIVCVGTDDALVAFNAAEGQKIWNFTLGDMVLYPLAIAKGTVYVGSDDACLYAFDAQNGDRLWSFAAGAAFRCVPAVADGMVYASSDDGYVYALDTATGSKVWSYDTTPTEYVWQKSTQFPQPAQPSSPIVYNDAVYFTVAFQPQQRSTPGGTIQPAEAGWSRVYALNAADGVPVWNTTVHQWSEGSTVVVVDEVVYACGKSGILGFNCKDGVAVWGNNTRVDLAYLSSPAVADGVVYVGSTDGQLCALKGPDAAAPAAFSAVPLVVVSLAAIGCVGLAFYFKRGRSLSG